MIMGRCKKCGREGYLDTFEHIPCYGTVCTDGYGCAIPPSENTCVCCGEVIPEGEQVCLHCQRIEHPLYLEKLKRTHAKISNLGEWNVEKKDTPVDIHKIIDDAMEKRDRTVSIYIGEAGVSVNVSPVDHDKCQWIETDEGMICSNCGNRESTWDTPTYCSKCGELMHGVRKEKNS